MKRIKLFISALVLSLSSVFTFAVPRALAATVTWDGGGSDNKMTTDENWVGDSAPSEGDTLVFPANVENRTVVNDFAAGTAFNSIVFSGEASQASNYTISGNAIVLTAGITDNMTGTGDLRPTIELDIALGGNQTFKGGTNYMTLSGDINLGSHTLTLDADVASIVLSGVVSGSGNLVKTGEFYARLSGANEYTGTTTISEGYITVSNASALGTTDGATVVQPGAYLELSFGNDVSIAEPLQLTGNGTTTSLAVVTNKSTTPPYDTTTLTGPITLNSNVIVRATGQNGKITGPITGEYTISLTESSTGTFELASSSNGSATPNGVLEQSVEETKYEDDAPNTGVSVYKNKTAIITGTYGWVYVYPGGTLKGTGTVGNVTVEGTVAPGLSPGCLSTGNLTMQPGATYEFELGGTTACDGYDQIKVTGTVQISGTLEVSRYNNFVPTAGQKYVIIDNDGTDQVDGTFEGLAEGATFDADGVTFSISYVGGDGNDVELTVTAVSPDTGFALLTNNPYVTMALMLGAAGTIALLARRQFGFAARKR